MGKIASLLTILILVSINTFGKSEGLPAPSNTAGQIVDRAPEPTQATLTIALITGAFTFLGIVVTAYFSYRKAKASAEARSGKEEAEVIKEIKRVFSSLQNTQQMQGLTLDNINKQVIRTNGRVDGLEQDHRGIAITIAAHNEKHDRHNADIQEIKNTLQRMQDHSPKA